MNWKNRITNLPFNFMEKSSYSLCTEFKIKSATDNQRWQSLVTFWISARSAQKPDIDIESLSGFSVFFSYIKPHILRLSPVLPRTEPSYISVNLWKGKVLIFCEMDSKRGDIESKLKNNKKLTVMYKTVIYKVIARLTVKCEFVR